MQNVTYAAAFAPNVPVSDSDGLQGEFGLTLTQDGFLATAFMVGFALMHPMFRSAHQDLP